MEKKINRVTIVFAILAIATLFMPGFVYFKKMRIQTSAAINASTCFGKGYYLILAGTVSILLLNCTTKIWARYASGIIVGITVVLSLYIMSKALTWIPLDKTEYSRLSIGPAMWLWLLCMFCIIVKINEALDNIRKQRNLYAIPVIGIAFLTILGQLNGLAIMIEYNTIRSQFWKALGVHIKFSLIIMAVSIVIGIPLGYAVNKRKLLETIVFSIMNLIETIPGISLIAILIIPLSALSNKYPVLANYGIMGFGMAPAFIALVFYALFPLVHNTRAAFKLVDDYYIEIAHALGMNRKRTFFTITLPMAFPTILSGIRIAAVYTFTGMVLAAFIGGGGLGFYMINSDSMDLILLGVIPMIIITFIVDNGLKWAVEKMSYGR